jgi:hypothetical protein
MEEDRSRVGLASNFTVRRRLRSAETWLSEDEEGRS